MFSNIPHYQNTCFFSVCINMLSYVKPIVEHCKNILKNCDGDVFGDDHKNRPIQPVIDLARMIVKPGNHPWFDKKIYKSLFKSLGLTFGESNEIEHTLYQILKLLGIENNSEFAFIGPEEVWVYDTDHNNTLQLIVDQLDYPKYVITTIRSDIGVYVEHAYVNHHFSHFTTWFPYEDVLLDDLTTPTYPHGHSGTPSGTLVAKLMVRDW